VDLLVSMVSILFGGICDKLQVLLANDDCVYACVCCVVTTIIAEATLCDCSRTTSRVVFHFAELGANVSVKR
jgi:hypothetical protein